MKSRTEMMSMTAYRFAALAIMFITTMAAANAQQRSTGRKGSTMWAGGNRTSQTNQLLPAASNANLETNNQDARCGNVRYDVMPIGVLSGKTTSFLTLVRGVNNREHVTGYSYVYNGNIALTGQGFIWQHGRLEALPLLNGWPGAFAFGINDRDQVVGTANDVDASGNLSQTAVLWEHEQPVNLGALHPGRNSYALDVSTSAVVVGASGSVGAEFPTPVVWSEGAVHELPLLPGEAGGWAQEINARGVIVGWQVSATNEIPCLWYESREPGRGLRPGVWY